MYNYVHMYMTKNMRNSVTYHTFCTFTCTFTCKHAISTYGECMHVNVHCEPRTDISILKSSIFAATATREVISNSFSYGPTTNTILNVCASIPCKNNGSCVLSLDKYSSYLCQCTVGFVGTQCEAGKLPYIL